MLIYGSFKTQKLTQKALKFQLLSVQKHISSYHGKHKSALAHSTRRSVTLSKYIKIALKLCLRNIKGKHTHM